jgi:hypothetical protein
VKTWINPRIYAKVREVRVPACRSRDSGDERTSLSFTVAAGPPTQLFSGPSPRGSHDHIFTVSNVRLPQPGGPMSWIYLPQEEGIPSIPQALDAINCAIA